MNKYVIIDLETTGQSVSAGEKIIEVGIVTIEDDKIVDRYTSFINPGKPIPPFITNLTTIENEQVAEAPYFYEKAVEISEKFTDAYFIAHNVPFDLNFLNEELGQYGFSQLNNPVIDTVELARILYPLAPSYQLERLADYLHVNHDKPHRALADAEVTAELFLMMKKKLLSLPKKTVHHLLKLAPHLQSDLKHLLDESYNKHDFNNENQQEQITYRSLSIKKVMPSPSFDVVFSDGFGYYLDDLYEEAGTLSKRIENYEHRSSQREISEIIYDAFKQKKHALLEAGTGTGKTLAYLITAVYEAVLHHKQVIISTHTLHLQTQILDELMRLKDVIPFPFTASLLKGKGRYLSLERFDQVLNNSISEEMNYDTVLTKAMLLIWITETHTGDLDELQLPTNGELLLKRVSVEAEQFMHIPPNLRDYSYYERTKSKATQADLLITNHALVCADLNHEGELLPKSKYFIIDEAHHLQAAATQHFGIQLDYAHLHYLYNKIGHLEKSEWLHILTNRYEHLQTFLEKEVYWSEHWSKIKSLTDELFSRLHEKLPLTSDEEVSDTGKVEAYLTEATLREDTTAMLTQTLLFTFDEVKSIFYKMESFIQTDEELTELFIHRKQFLELVKDITNYFSSTEDDRVRWLEYDQKGGKSSMTLYAEQIDVAQFLQKQFFAKKHSVVLLSATLTTSKQSFSYMKKRLGLIDENLFTKSFPSPFSLKEQVQLLVPNDFPQLTIDKQDDYVYAIAESILSIASITKGRMLVLFTSYHMLKQTHYLLKEMMELNDSYKFMLISQGISSGSRSRLKKNFQMFEQAILLGTNSFWEGIDLPGDQLSALVITRLPFQRPNHPVFLAEQKRLKENEGNPFYELSLPDAVLRFKQGFGRLIRSRTDRGIIFVCDRRFLEANYSKAFTESLGELSIYNEPTKELLERVENTFKNNQSMDD